MKFFYFLTQKKFYLHLAIGIVAAILILWFVLKGLSFFTFHGEAINVPPYYGQTMEFIEGQENPHHFRYVVADSIYDTEKEPGTVIQQNPLPNSKVKRNRKIYLTIVAFSAEKVLMPNLVDLSYRQALVTLKTYDLKINVLHYIPDFAQNAVLAQLYDGDTINPGDTIYKGAKVDLILGQGYDPRKQKVPFLIGLSRQEATDYLHQASFNIGELVYLDEYDPQHSKVYLQEPAYDSDSLLNQGDFISLWFRSDLDINYEEYIQSLFPDTLALDSLYLEMDSIMYYEYLQDSIRRFQN